MYPISRFMLRLSATLTLAALLAGIGYSDEASTPPPPPQSAPAAPAVQPAPAQPANDEQAKSAATVPAETPAAVPAPSATPPQAAKDSTPAPAAPAVAAPAAPAPEAAQAEKPERAEKPEQPERPEQPEKPERPERPERRHGNDGGQDVAPFSDVFVPKDAERREAVAVVGNVTIDGTVSHDSVAIAGTNLVRGSVGHDTVVVGGNSIITGHTGHDAVAVFSDLYLNGTVGHDVVVVFGNLHLGPDARIDGHKVLVMGRTITLTKEAIDGFTSADFAGQIPSLGGVGEWVRSCLLHGRLLAFSPHVAFAWIFAITLLAFYVLVALIFPKAVSRCVQTVEERPGMSLVAFFLTLLLLPFVLVILAVTGIGAVVDVVLLLALFLSMRFGRVVIHAWMGKLVTRYLPEGPLTHVAFSVLVGGLMIALLYCVPFVGFMVHALIGFFGLGAVVLTLITVMTRDRKQGAKAAQPPVPPVAPPAPPPVAPAPVAPLAAVAEPTVASAPQTSVEPPPSIVPPPVSPVTIVPPPPPTLPPLISPAPAAASKAEAEAAARLAALAYPRATFFQRVGAMLIDLVLVAVVAGVLLPHFMFPGSGPGRLLVAMAIYGAIFWKLRGTTIGGIILRLEVVRADGRPLDWTTCIVRGLGCLLSIVFAGLGFFWIAIDDKREAWHDKIAGTIVVRAPNHRPLV